MLELLTKFALSKIDLLRAFLYISVADDDFPKIAVTTPFGLFEYYFVNFSLCNSFQTFQQFMNKVMKRLEFFVVNIDNIHDPSFSPQHYAGHIWQVLELQDCGLKLYPKK